MAGPAADFTLPSSPFFNIYTDGGRGPVPRTSPAPARPPSPAPALPSGQCNFVDLTHGANGPKCGCRRFWSRSALSPQVVASPAAFPGYYNGLAMGAGADQAFWCMCSHHACFHDDIRDSYSQGPPVMAMPPSAVEQNIEQENERPRNNREPLTPVIPELSFPMPLSSGHPTDFQTLNNGLYDTNSKEPGQGSQTQANSVNHEPSMPDTLSWTNLIQSQPGDQANNMPPIPSQCLLQSQPSSTTSSVRMRYLQPFGGKGLQTLNGARTRARGTPLATVQDSRAPEENAAEPSVVASNDDLPTVTNTPRSIRRMEERNTKLQSSKPGHGEFQDLSSTVQGHGQRLDRLENVSFPTNGHDECYEKHDHVDLRVTELELRVGELEKQLQDSSSVATSRYRHTGADDSTASVVSAATNTSDRSHLYSELQALRAELNNISSDPTYGNPWELEVVFLPFPLKGVWMQPGDLMSQRLPGTSHADVDQWTQMPNSDSLHEPRSPAFNEWADPELEFEWLLPRACPPDRMIDKRLQSRGLVKKVLVRGPDAHSVQQAIAAAFGTSFRTVSRIQSNFYHGSDVHHRVGKFLGLQQPWVPLRKVHKDSRLRFLSPSEMITPAIWDVRFLKSSVVMKATGVNRLYITQPEAYLQDQDAYENGWSWQRLRELSRIYPDSQSSQQDVPEADALEDCWAFNDKLDESPSTQSSFSSHLSLRQAAQPRLKSTSISPSPQHFFTSHNGRSPSLTTGRRSRAPSPFVALREQKSGSPLRPLHVRTNSMPPVLPGVLSPQQARRRMASVGLSNAQPYPYDRRPSPQIVRASANAAHSIAFAAQKRRRATRSPSVPMSARFRRTPRYSTASPSPGPAGFGAPGATSGRATTPFFYATPYSNAPFVDNRPHQGVMDEVDEDNRGSGTDSYADGSGDEDESDYEDDAQMLDLGHPRQRFNTDDETWQGAAQEPQHFPLPEDEPWPGIEDEDLENREPALKAEHIVDIYEDEDAMSDIDSQMTVSQLTEKSGRSVEGEIDEGAMAERVVDHGVGKEVVANGDTEVASQHSSVPSEYPSTQRAWTDGAMGFEVYEDLTNKKNP